MKYSWERVVNNISSRWKAYLVILINFMLGVALFTVCMNYRWTSQELLRKSKKSSSEEVIKVSYHGIGSGEQKMGVSNQVMEMEGEPQVFPIPYEKYQSLQENDDYLAQLEMLYDCHFASSTIILDPTSFLEMEIFFMNEALFSYLYGFIQEGDCVYLGEAAYETLLQIQKGMESGGKENIILPPVSMTIENEQFIMGDGTAYRYEVVSVIDKDQTAVVNPQTGEIGYDMSDAVIIPLEEAAKLPTMEAALHNTLLLKYRHEEWREDLVPQVLNELTKSQPDKVFVADSAYLDLKKQMDDLRYDMDSWLILSVSIMLLAGIGCVGLMFLLLNQRKHFFAVSIAYGSTYKRLVIENLAEVGSILLLGGILGVVISPIMRGILLYQGELMFDIRGIGILGVLIALFSILSVMLGMYAVRVGDVVRTLREE